MSQRIYIAGPMRGIEHWNFPAFDAAAQDFRALGWVVVSPADLDREAGFNPNATTLPEGFLRDAMKRDLPAICDCDAIALLPGWEQSKGVEVELTLARFLGLRVIDARDPKPPCD